MCKIKSTLHWNINSQHPLSLFQVLCLWDVSSQLCIHRLGGVFPAAREDARTLLLLIEERQLLLLTFNSLLVLLESTKEETRASGHKHPVTCVLYNSLFRHVRIPACGEKGRMRGLDGCASRVVKPMTPIQYLRIDTRVASPMLGISDRWTKYLSN